MKLKPSEIAAFLRKPSDSAPAVLIYGPDEGLVRERTQMLGKAVAGDLKDPFRVATLELSDIKDDPARLHDEAQALSMIGGKRVVLISGATDALGAPMGKFLEDCDATKGAPVSLVIVSAGDLGPRSSLRKAFEDAKLSPAIPCYADDAGSLESMILGRAGRRRARRRAGRARFSGRPISAPTARSPGARSKSWCCTRATAAGGKQRADRKAPRDAGRCPRLYRRCGRSGAR